MSCNNSDKTADYGLSTTAITITTSRPPRPKNVGFNFTHMDWVAYTAFRPAYPDALYETIYAHHELHGGTTQSALDVGAGIGIVTARLLDKFKHVTLSDASELYISQAKQVFSHRPQSQLSFVHGTAEQLGLDLLPNGRPVDLIVAGMCLHWTDLDVCVPRFASMLKPNGTFAAWVYGSRPVISQDPDLVQVRQLIDAIIDQFGHAYESQIEQQRENGAAAILNARLDRIDFDPSVWTAVRRIHANKSSTMTCDWWPAAPSRVRPKEAIEELDDAAFLSREVDFDWLKGYLSNLIPVINVPELVQTELTNLEAVLAGRTVQLRWSLAMVLATKI